MLSELTILIASPWLWDAAVRLRLARAARRWTPLPTVEQPALRWLVLVPARGEGDAVRPTLRSISAAKRQGQVDVVVLLDGDDPVAERATSDLGFQTMVKRPAGPTKGAVLGWAADNLGDRLANADVVFVLDVGSVIPSDFFVTFGWPTGADAVQAFLAGTGTGVARAAAFSERTAQLWHDRGRQALGWNVRLRGTGTAFTTAAFLDVARRLITSVEDAEATLLLASEGATTVLGPVELQVKDIKPEAISLAARQRSRWLAGQLGLLFRRPGTLLRLISRHPFEGLAFAAELVSRPLSLTGGLRLLGGIGWTIAAVAGGWPAGPTVLAGVLLASVASDLMWIRQTGVASCRETIVSFLSLGAAWVGALTLLPRTIGRWMRGRK
ncbi:MAG: glycosyltransferase [Acidobacteria bacterium]|nr:glycosyltransferase [Acidobacteriota bacterium]